MEKLQSLKKRVAELYEAKHPDRDVWTDWLYSQHVPFVAAKARQVAEVHGGDPDLAEAAGWLHDIADVKMARAAEGHEEESLAIGRELMKQSGYSQEEIALVVDDAVRFHSCHDGVFPQTAEGKALATADALAHFQTDFYIFSTRNLRPGMTIEEIKAWTLKKIERDLSDKICYDDVREEVRPDYEVVKNLFSRAPVQSRE